MNVRKTETLKPAKSLSPRHGSWLPAGVFSIALLGALSTASAQGAAYSASTYGARRMTYAVCDRARVRECQADARQHVQFCEAFPGRLACADRALTELQMCWAATGCW